MNKSSVLIAIMEILNGYSTVRMATSSGNISNTVKKLFGFYFSTNAIIYCFYIMVTSEDLVEEE